MTRRQILRAAMLAGTSLATLAIASPAQETMQPSQAETRQDGDVVVVTAQRREETVLDVPMAVQAFTGEDLETLRVNDVKDLSAVGPSFTVSQSYQGVPICTLRGIGFNTIHISSTSTIGGVRIQRSHPAFASLPTPRPAKRLSLQPDSSLSFMLAQRARPAPDQP